MKKENNKYLIIFIVIIGLVFLINGGKKEAGTTVSINLDTMTVDNEAIQNTDCDNENEYVTLMDSEEIDVRSVFVGGFPNDYNNIIPSGKTITSATWEFKTRDVFYDDGTERDYSKVKCYVSGSRDSNDCDSCMSFDDSFEDCNIDNGDQLIKNGKLYDSTWYSIDVTATFKYAYENNKFFAIWCKGDTSDSDDLTLTEVWGSNAGTSAPFIDVTYDSGNGGTGCSETDNGIIINGNVANNYCVNEGERYFFEYYCTGDNSFGTREIDCFDLDFECTQHSGVYGCYIQYEECFNLECYNGNVWCYDTNGERPDNSPFQTCMGYEACLGGECIQQTCSELNGDICSYDESCPTFYYESSDSSKCCESSCNPLDGCHQSCTPYVSDESICSSDKTYKLSNCEDVNPDPLYIKFCYSTKTVCGNGKECKVSNEIAVCVDDGSGNGGEEPVVDPCGGECDGIIMVCDKTTKDCKVNSFLYIIGGLLAAVFAMKSMGGK